jgi:polysaccharide export outer membrane protein
MNNLQVLCPVSFFGGLGVRIFRILGVIALTFVGIAAQAGTPQSPATNSPTPEETRALAQFKPPLLQLGPGDSVAIVVYGQTDMGGTVYVSDDGTIPVALAGPVQVSGLSPSQASARIEKALRDGKFLVDPHVTLTVTQTVSQRVSVVGDVGKPGRYAIESNTSIFDLLAEAGGVTEVAGDTVDILRGADGNITRIQVSLKSLSGGGSVLSTPSLKGGDTVFVPRAPQFYIYGEVATPGKFKVEIGMTVVQAIARAGGLTQRGSASRVVVKRTKADGTYETTKAKLSDLVQADDVIRVKESIF